MKTYLVVIALLAAFFPSVKIAAAQQNSPPIQQELVREGDFATDLVVELGLGTTDDETEAESILARAGISPRNGWIADYPVTPDIVGELRQSVAGAANTRKIPLGNADALSRFDRIAARFQLAIKPHTPDATYPPDAEGPAYYPNPSAINDYYDEEGPPVVTYYTPPPSYYDMYGWVPYSFWWEGLWFPGFYVLNDFHRPIHYRNRGRFISNHFNDVRAHRVYRVDPVNRYRGRTFSGIGAVGRRRDFISTGVPRAERRIFNAPRPQHVPGTWSRSGERPAPAGHGVRMNAGPPVRRGGAAPAPAAGRSGRSGAVAPPAGITGGSPGGGVVAPHGGGGAPAAPAPGGGGHGRGNRR